MISIAHGEFQQKIMQCRIMQKECWHHLDGKKQNLQLGQKIWIFISPFDVTFVKTEVIGKEKVLWRAAKTNKKNKKMKNLIITSVLIVLGILTLNAQNQYSDGMKKAFELWEKKKPTEAIALFERIGQAEKDNWIPLYHSTNILIVEAFRSEDKTERMAMLEKAKETIKSAHERSPDNSELLTLEGMLYTGYVAMEPQVYAMKYSQKIMELHDKAIELNPENPRAHANRIEYEMGTARFFKQDLQPFCDRLEKVIPKFEAQNLDIPFCPKYGKERVESIIKNCGKS